ncbi:MAG: glycosyltransferase-like protein [uncultured bacterium]|nr:MAG: glycosyltransferase-like protein [uncultured bacterium]
MIKSFGAKSEIIDIAQDDIPKNLDKNLISKWKIEIRNNLNITHESIVYCYNGSIKAWQCPQEVITFFKSCLNNKTVNKNIFLLILTQDAKEFENLIKKENIQTDLYLIKTVAHQEIYKYLAACDYGIIFREESIVNWVSRPTKILEYESVGLKIIHNNTVGLLKNREYN